MRIAALDVVQKLLAHGHLHGQSIVQVAAGEGAVSEEPLINSVVDSLCLCRGDSSDPVQLQLIKALLTCTTSTTCAVHGRALVQAVSTVVHVFLVTKNGVNRTTAKASLKQMINFVFQRMEQARAAEEAGAAGTYAASSEAASDAAPVPASAAGTADALFESDAVTLFRALCRMCSKEEGASALGGEDGVSLTANTHVQAPSALASLFTGTKTPAAGEDDAVTLASRLLALEMLFGILERAGPAFRGGLQFLQVIQGQLCVALLRNALHSVSTVASLSLRIFLVLLRSFSTQLLPEIETFITRVLLRVLDSPSTGAEVKLLVLSVFRSIGADARATMELFLNYDCVEGRSRVFEAMTRALSSIAQGRASDSFNSTQKTAAEASAARNVALDALSSMLGSVVAYADEAAAASGLLAVTASDGEEEDDGATAPAADATQGGESSLPAAEEGEDGEEDEEDAAAPASGLATDYGKLKRRRALLERAALKFKLKPKRGIAWMVEVGLIADDTPASIAAALYEFRDSLDKTAIGVYLGGDKPVHLEVLEAYAAQMQLQGMSFDGAIRHYLTGFRIPGEAQKIDRIMERFAEVYYQQNPGIFPNADTAFVLAYSVIMLNTSLHNPSIKLERRMTPGGFINQNRGIADGQDLPEEFLVGIYNSIKSEPISLREDQALRARMAARDGSAKVRKDAGAAEREAILKDGTQAMQRGSATGSGEPGGYRSAEGVALDTVRAVFDVLWGSLLAVFSINLETSSDATLVQACLEGFASAVHVAGLTGMTTERDALVMSLAKFTLLDQPGREMRSKHVAAVKTIMQLAIQDGRFLGDAWWPVLTCVSQVGRLHNLAAGGMADSAFFPGQAQHARGGSRGSWRRGSTGASESERARAVAEAAAAERANAQAMVAAVPEDWITRVFTSSARLDSSAVMEFVGHLANVSLQELHLPAMPGGLHGSVAETPGSPTASKGHGRRPSDATSVSSASTMAGAGAGVALSLHGPPGAGASPRVFSLQKLVEVADYNMDGRPRVIWATMWDALSRYFTAVGCHTNINVSMYAVDCLKQLTMKFLGQGELKHFHFQPKFLAPFLAILNARPPAAPMVRELVLSVFGNILRSRADSLSSGWSTLLLVHSAAAGDREEVLVSAAFDAMHVVMTHHITAIARHGAFDSLVRTLTAFAANPAAPELVALRAVDHLAALGSMVARGAVPLTKEEAETPLAVPAPGALPGTYDGATWYNLQGEGNQDLQDMDTTHPPLTPAQPDADVDAGRAQRGAAAAAEAAGGHGAADDAVVMEGDQALYFIRAFTDSEAHLQAWWPLLTGLAGLVGGVRVEVRNRALNVLFALLRRFGPGFDAALWALVYSGVLLPLFDDVTHAPEDGAPTAAPGHMSESSWLKTTCMAALSSLVRLQIKFFGRLHPQLPSLLQLLKRTIHQDIEGLARIGVACLQLLLAEAGGRFDADVWDQITATLADLFARCTPQSLLDARMVLCGSAASPQPASDEEVEYPDVPSPQRPPVPGAAAPSATAAAGDAAAPSVFAGASTSIAPTLPFAGHDKHLAPELARILAQRLLSRNITTTLGRGSVLGIRGDGAAAVQLEWGLLFAPRLAAVLVAPTVEEVLATSANPDAPQAAPAVSLPFKSQSVITQCVVQLELISSVGILVQRHLANLSEPQLTTLVAALRDSAAFAARFNKDRDLRRALWRAGFMRFNKQNKLPSLMRQETSAYMQLAALLFKLQAGPDGEHTELVTRELRRQFRATAKRFSALSTERVQTLARSSSSRPKASTEREVLRELTAYAPFVQSLLQGLDDIPDETLQSWISWLYPALVSLAPAANQEVQDLVAALLLRRLPPLMGLTLEGADDA